MKGELESTVAGHHLEHLAAALLKLRTAPMAGMDAVVQNASPDAARHQFEEFSVLLTENLAAGQGRR
jgi:hypothetical protein